MGLIDAAGEYDRVVVKYCQSDAVWADGGSQAIRDLEHDASSARGHGVDLIFHQRRRMYGDQFYSYVDMDAPTKGFADSTDRYTSAACARL